uniref:ascorbate ferrireductase (transmembrane) n=1 Tax=Onchocerca volvulus TaxID=6282 RepID=A0A8R1TWA9_ONCVO
MRWSVSGRGSFLRLRLEALLNDLPSYAMYIALGFSNDQHMGDDTVLECLYNGIDEGRAYLSYNDGTYNARLYEATAILIVNSSFVVNDGTFTCLLDVNFKQLNLLSTEDKSRIHNILVHPYYLQFVRGSIDQYCKSYVKKMHSLSDGSLYPWTTETAINMPRNKDGKYENIENAQQVKWFSRRITYAMVTLHAILMIWSWWFFLSNAILISRYFKTFWPTVEIDHRPIWFQLHRGGALISIMLQTVAIFLIIIQSRFQLYLWCTRQCTIQHCMKPTHTWAGLNAYILAVMQTVIALNQFKWKFIKRFYFRWFHRFVAIVAFVAASSGILSATTLNKTGLIQNYGKWPILLVGLYLCTFSVVLFGFSFLDAYHAKKIAEKNEVGQKECIGQDNSSININSACNNFICCLLYHYSYGPYQLYQETLIISCAFIAIMLSYQWYQVNE